LGGQVDLFFATPQSVVQLVKTGKLKAFGVTSKDRIADLPNVESFVSVLGPKLDFVYWQALFAPAKTPPAVIKVLNQAAQQAVADPAIVKNWATQGISVFPPDQRSPEAAEAFFKSEIARWGQVIRDNNIHLDQ
jgi:tripartite-type tricarboxylate transporter receptor subunit TctC